MLSSLITMTGVMQNPDVHEEQGKDISTVDLDELSPDGDGDSKRVKRTVFTRHQLVAMETRFVEQTFLSKEERREMATELGLTERQIMVWFQNRRGRLKKRGPSDVAYSAEKLDELNSCRPYPFLYGLLSSMQFRYGHPHPYQHLCDTDHPGGVKTEQLGPPNITTSWNQGQATTVNPANSPPKFNRIGETGIQVVNNGSPPQNAVPEHLSQKYNSSWSSDTQLKYGMQQEPNSPENLAGSAYTQGMYCTPGMRTSSNPSHRSTHMVPRSKASSFQSQTMQAEQIEGSIVKDQEYVNQGRNGTRHEGLTNCPGDIMVVSTTHAVRIGMTSNTNVELPSAGYVPVEQNSASYVKPSDKGINIQQHSMYPDYYSSGVQHPTVLKSSSGLSYTKSPAVNMSKSNITIENEVHVTAKNHRFNPYQRHTSSTGTKSTTNLSPKAIDYNNHVSSPKLGSSCGTFSQYHKGSHHPISNFGDTNCAGNYLPAFNHSGSIERPSDSHTFSGYLPENFTFDIPDISAEYGSNVIAGEQNMYFAARQNCAFAMY